MSLPYYFKSVGFVMAIISLSGFTVQAASAQQDASQPSAQGAEQLTDPGPEHQRLASMAGRWNVDAKYFWAGPQQVTRSQATAVFSMILGGRFLKQEYRDEINGQPFEGIGLSGYDRIEKKIVGTWIDNMGTGLMTVEGKMLEDGSMVEHGTSSSPMGKLNLRMVSKPINEDKFTYTMYMVLPDGNEQKVMELIYTRAEDA